MKIAKDSTFAQQLAQLFETKPADIDHFILIIDTDKGVQLIHTLPTTADLQKTLYDLARRTPDAATVGGG